MFLDSTVVVDEADVDLQSGLNRVDIYCFSSELQTLAFNTIATRVEFPLPQCLTIPCRGRELLRRSKGRERIANYQASEDYSRERASRRWFVRLPRHVTSQPREVPVPRAQGFGARQLQREVVRPLARWFIAPWLCGPQGPEQSRGLVADASPNHSPGAGAPRPRRRQRLRFSLEGWVSRAHPRVVAHCRLVQRPDWSAHVDDARGLVAHANREERRLC